MLARLGAYIRSNEWTPSAAKQMADELALLLAGEADFSPFVLWKPTGTKKPKHDAQAMALAERMLVGSMPEL